MKQWPRYLYERSKQKTPKSWETLRTSNWLSSLESNICQYRWKQLRNIYQKSALTPLQLSFAHFFLVFTTLRCPRPSLFVSVDKRFFVIVHHAEFRFSSVSANWGWFLFSYFTARIYMYLHGHEKILHWCRLVYWLNKFCIFMYALSSFSVW